MAQTSKNHPSNSRKLLYLTLVLPPILNCMALENKNSFLLKFIVRLALFFLCVKNPEKALSKVNSTCHSRSSTRPPPQNDMATSDGNRLGHVGFALCWEKILPPSTTINLWDNKSACPRICCTRKIPVISSKSWAAKRFLEDFRICGSSDASYWRRILWGQPSH